MGKLIAVILTFLIVLLNIIGAIWGFFFLHIPMLGVVCVALAVCFGIFSYNDYRSYFGKSK